MFSSRISHMPRSDQPNRKRQSGNIKVRNLKTSIDTSPYTRAMRPLALMLLLSLAVLISACGGDDPTATPTATSPATATPTVAAPSASPTATTGGDGTLEVRVTDLPNRAITAIDIVAEQVQVHSASTGEWITVVEGPVSFDLIAVAGIEEVLGSDTLEPGEYTQIRLTITKTTITVDGEQVEATVPGETLRIVRPFTIVAGEITIATLDFDAERSVVAQGTGKYLLKPVVTLLVRRSDEPFEPVVTDTPTPTATATPTPTQEPTGDFFLAIEEPEEIESIVAEASITVVGRTRIDAVVSVGDIFAEVDENGRFRVLVALEEGPNVIEIVASVEAGDELVEILIVIYSP